MLISVYSSLNVYVVNIELKNNDGATPMEVARMLGHQEMVDLLETNEQTLSRSPLIFRTKSATLDSSSVPKSRTSSPG